MPYAEVCVNIPSRERKTYSYSIPKDIHLSVGDMVWVPFGAQTLQGIVFDITDDAGVEETKDITGVIDTPAGLLPHQISLAQWISDYYLCPLFEAASLMLAPGAERNSSILLVPSLFSDDASIDMLSPLQKAILKVVQEKGAVSLDHVKKVTRKKNLSSSLSYLLKKGFLERTYRFEAPKVNPKTARFVRLKEGAVFNEKQLKEKQRAVLTYLTSFGESGENHESNPLVPVKLVTDATGASPGTIQSLAKRNAIEVVDVEVLRDPLQKMEPVQTNPIVLTKSQERIWERIKASFKNGTGSEGSLSSLEALPGSDKMFLLHGVTGSGKTEIYLKALEEVVSQGKQGIVLVPEISLTPQTIQRFRSRFPGRVAVLHSHLSPGERFDEWRRIRRGDVDVVVGARSAVFAPTAKPGVIILDEEHEWAYKSDGSPYYHARDVALRLSYLTGATVILGSATPDLESYQRTRDGAYTLLELPERVSTRDVGKPDDGEKSGAVPSLLPPVEIVDLRRELRAGNMSIFSRSLRDAMVQALSKDEQIILFLNRRGTSSIVVCRECGYVVQCRRCDSALTYHRAQESLICHLCNRRAPIPTLCPKCHSKRIKYLGIGTQKVEEETAKAFPSARLLRWDSDVTGPRHAHEEILNKFASHEADILIGTQMVAKGLNLPLVTLVGVINADVGLHLPDFRAGERTFQLLTQVAGRAGRGDTEGRVVIQTYTPEHYAIKTASRHDYRTFFNTEIHYRRERSNPPFGKLARLTYSHSIASTCQREAMRVSALLKEEMSSRGIDDISLLGPAPAFVSRLRGRHRWQIVLRGKSLHRLLHEVVLPRGWMVDVDPVSLL